MKRLYDLKSFSRFLNDALNHLGDMRIAGQKGVAPQFGERIMLAVTGVNGCRYCSYFHTRKAFEAGVTQTEIEQLMSADFVFAPEDQQLALLFAQHYAETAGLPEDQALQRLEKTYGADRSRGILAYIRMIMIGNVFGNAFDALRHRLMGKPVDRSRVGDELGVLFGAVVLVPWILFRMALSRIIRSIKN